LGKTIDKDVQFRAIYFQDFSRILKILNRKQMGFTELRQYLTITPKEFLQRVMCSDILNNFSPESVGNRDGFFILSANGHYSLNFQERGKVYKRMRFKSTEDVANYIANYLYTATMNLQ
jgi:hypothetical protein